MTTKNGHQNETSAALKRVGVLREPAEYWAALVSYWPLILGIGLFFGWLISFPMQGPLAAILAESAGINPTVFLTWFLFGHILGLGIAGISGYYQRRYLVLYSLGAVPAAILTIIFTGLSPAWWPFILGLMGFFAGVVVISWGSHFACLVGTAQRGRTFVMCAALANLILYAVNQASLYLNPQIILIPLGIITLAMPVMLIYRYRQLGLDNAALCIKEIPGPPGNALRTWSYLLFIFAIYTVSGLLFAVVPESAAPSTGLLPYYALIPYIVLLFVAGSVADRIGRRLNAVLGVITVGFGLMTLSLLKGNWQFFSIQTLVIGGYAFLDTFTWVMAADMAGRRRFTLAYAMTLGVNLLAILAGVLLAGQVGKMDSAENVLIVSLSFMFSLVSLIFVLNLRETLQHGSPVLAASGTVSLAALVQKTGLTPREADIAALLVAGASTQEILDKLVITDNTLKSHLRNLYRKVGARNRVEFTLAVLREYTPPAENGDQNTSDAKK